MNSTNTAPWSRPWLQPNAKPRRLPDLIEHPAGLDKENYLASMYLRGSWPNGHRLWVSPLIWGSLMPHQKTLYAFNEMTWGDLSPLFHFGVDGLFLGVSAPVEWTSFEQVGFRLWRGDAGCVVHLIRH